MHGVCTVYGRVYDVRTWCMYMYMVLYTVEYITYMVNVYVYGGVSDIHGVLHMVEYVMCMGYIIYSQLRCAPLQAPTEG